MAAWRSALPVLLVAAFLAVEELVSVPMCEISGGGKGGGEKAGHPDDLKVMMVADLLLLGSEAAFADRFFRDIFTSKFFSKSFERFKPDMLVVLGDISARGFELTDSKWVAVMQQFQRMLGPFMGFPLHIALGDRDIGECSKLDENFVSRIASYMPGLDSASCSTFEIANISFVSLNAVAMLCGNNNLRFDVEKVVERESVHVQTHVRDASVEPAECNEKSISFSNSWRENDMASSSGPIVLIHFPLHRSTRIDYEMSEVFEVLSRGAIAMGPYDLKHTVPPNATEYIIQALKPRIVFSAHAHKFCDHTHSDGTREVTVPAMTWAARGRPGFVFVTFGQNKAVSVSHCSLPKESSVIMAYASMLMLSIAATLVMR